jgi:hypothetical protein
LRKVGGRLGEIGDIGGRAATPIHDRGSKQDQAAECKNKPNADLKEDRLPELLYAGTSQALKAGAAESCAVVDHALVLVVCPESHNGVHGHQDGECYSDGREAVGCHLGGFGETNLPDVPNLANRQPGKRNQPCEGG